MTLKRDHFTNLQVLFLVVSTDFSLHSQKQRTGSLSTFAALNIVLINGNVVCFGAVYFRYVQS